MHCLVQAADIGFEQDLVWLDWYRVQATLWWQGKNTWSFPLPFDPKDGRQAVPAWFAPHSTLFENPIYFTDFMQILLKFCWKIDFLNFFNAAIWQNLKSQVEVFTAHNAKCLSKILEIIFLELFLPVSKFKSVFREKPPSNSRAKCGKNRDLWVK